VGDELARRQVPERAVRAMVVVAESEGAPSPPLEHRLPLLLDMRLTVEPGRPVCYFAAP